METIDYTIYFPQPQKSLAVINQTQVNGEIIETFTAAADWGGKVMIGSAALLFLAGFLAFLIWRGTD
jgi:hypothetical protein